jgi:hypothetical protein
MNLDKAALEYAKNHSAAPDKETPDWIIADFKAGIKWLATELEQLLIDLEEYFDERSDADFYNERYVPNEEMQLLSRIQDIQEKLSKEANKNLNENY